MVSAKKSKQKKVLIVCGTSAKQTNELLAKRCEEKVLGLHVNVLPVVNEFFGATVTCTGLLVGKDIARAVTEYMKTHGKVDEVMIAGNTLKEFEDVFLCGMTLDGLKEQIQTKNVRVNRDGGYGLIEIFTKKERKFI